MQFAGLDPEADLALTAFVYKNLSAQLMHEAQADSADSSR